MDQGSAGTTGRDIKPFSQPSLSHLQHGLVLRGVREGCYIVVTVFEKEMIGANHKHLQEGNFAACVRLAGRLAWNG